MRFAMVATPGVMADLRPARGALDGDVLRSRLPLPDTAFRIIDLDPAHDLAEQIGAAFDRGVVPSGSEILFYSSSGAVVSVEGELFLCLDPEHPETGDSLRDIVLLFRESGATRVAFVLDMWHAPSRNDARKSAAIVAAASAAVDSATSGFELLVASRPSEPDARDDRASPLTRALIEALDEPELPTGLSLAAFFEKTRNDAELQGAIASSAHTLHETSLALLKEIDGKAVSPSVSGVQAPSSGNRDERPQSRSSVGDASARVPAPPVAVETPRMEGAVAQAPPAAAAPSVPPSSVKPAANSSAKSVSTPPRTTTTAPPPSSAADHFKTGDELLKKGDGEAALAAYKRALAMLPTSAVVERAEIYVRLGQVKHQQQKRREAIANYDKALALLPPQSDKKGASFATQRFLLEALIELNMAEADHRALHLAEERVLALASSTDERFDLLMASASRWQTIAADAGRAKAALERARDLRPDDIGVHQRLLALYVMTGAFADEFATQRRIAELTREPRAKAERYFELGKTCLGDRKREDLGLSLLDLALEADPTMLEPLAIVARILAERQEWSELERCYRRMLDRVERIPEGRVRTDVAWELCRRLGLLFRDHLEDPALALDAFEDAVTERPDDLGSRLLAADLATSLGKLDRATAHLEAAAFLDPQRVATFHDLFGLFQKQRQPDQAFSAAVVTTFLRSTDTRERFVFEEHRPRGVIKPVFALSDGAWEWLRVKARDTGVEAVLEAVTEAAILARLSELANEGRLPELDPKAQEDREQSTVSIVRSFVWASHFLRVPAPPIFLHDDPQLSIAAVTAETPSVVAGPKVLRGRTLPELAFYAARHLAYHVGSHRLLLYFPSIEELTTCFLAALKVILPEIPTPPALRTAVAALEPSISARLSEERRVDLAASVASFEAQGSRARLSEWAADVERCATRAGFLLAGDLEVAAGILRGEPPGLLDAEVKIGDLLAFAVSSENHALRSALGIAVQP